MNNTCQALLCGVSMLVFFGILYWGAARQRWWSWLLSWAIVCILIVPVMFAMRGGEITPSMLGQKGSDAIIAACIGRWELSYRGNTPEWCPYIFGGMPAAGSLMAAGKYMPIGAASNLLSNYRLECEQMGKPARFSLESWAAGSLRLFVSPLKYVALVLLTGVYLVN